MLAIGGHCHREPFVVARHYFAGRLAVVDSPGPIVYGFRAIIALPLIADLSFIATPKLPRNAAEEHTAVQMLAITEAFELKHEIIPLALGLKIAGAVLDVQPSFL